MVSLRHRTKATSDGKDAFLLRKDQEPGLPVA